VSGAGAQRTSGTLLDGRVRYDQFAQGYRTGIEPVLLAAWVPARDGQRVIEAGSGAGAGLLCLAARVAGVRGLGVERDPALAGLARDNAAANSWQDRLGFRCLDVAALPWDEDRGAFDHAMANPPWHDPEGSASPDPGRDGAKRSAVGLLGLWVGRLALCLRPQGTLSLALPAAQLAQAVLAFADAGFGSLRVLPLWPHEGEAAKLVIVRATLGGRAATVLAAGLVLHERKGGYTAAADGVLRDGGSF
jgi:tRNA1Val (adenine37-N6)-methyltransferase